MCRERIERVSRAIRKVIKKNSSCRADSDCVGINPGTECRGSCGAYVNRWRADRVKRKIERLDRKFCSDFEEDGRRFEAVACPAAPAGILMPSCVDNRCTSGVSRGGFLQTIDLRP